MGSTTTPIQISQKRFVRLFKDTLIEKSNMRFCFLLGAGASRSSGISTKNDLTLKWFEEIVEDLETDQLEQWLEENGICTENLQQYHQQIASKRFQFEPGMCARIVEQQISLATPGLGYLILAQVLEKTYHNLAITSDADQLLEDALFSASSKAPLFYGQTCVDNTQFQQERPMVCKLHHNLTTSDSSVTTINNTSHAEYLQQLDIDLLATACKTFRPIFIGHSGNKHELMECLSQLPKTNRQPIFWCTLDTESISDNVLSVLTSKDFIVEIAGFDELMFEIINSFSTMGDLDSISVNYFHENHLVSLAREKAQRYKELLNGHSSFESMTNSGISEIEESSYVIDDMDQISDFMGSLEQPDHRENDKKHREAIAREPNSVSNNINYAIFLEASCNDPIKAVDYFQTAIRLAPKNENIKALYAFLLCHHLQDYDKAEIYYSNAFAIAPESVPVNILFGVFQHTIRKKIIAAEENFKAAFNTLDKEEKDNKGTEYADFMKEIRMDYYATEARYKRELEEVLHS